MQFRLSELISRSKRYIREWIKVCDYWSQSFGVAELISVIFAFESSDNRLIMYLQNFEQVLSQSSLVRSVSFVLELDQFPMGCSLNFYKRFKNKVY